METPLPSTEPTSPVGPMVVQIPTPAKSPSAKSKNILIISLLTFIMLPSLSVTGFFIYQNMPLKNQISQTTPTPFTSPKPTAEAGDPTANWKTYTNNSYHYLISYPSDFSVITCTDCQPPEARITLENKNKSVRLDIEYAHQFSLMANNSSPGIPKGDLTTTIMGKVYIPEQLYDSDYKEYIFKIEDINLNGQPTQIGISGSYNNRDSASLVAEILSTFTFIQ
jgi:hypothetical protein